MTGVGPVEPSEIVSSVDTATIAAPRLRTANRPARPGRGGQALFLVGSILVALGFLSQAWEFYYYFGPGVYSTVTQLQDDLFEWAIISSALIGTGILVSAVGWALNERAWARWTHGSISSSSSSTALGLILVGIGAVVIAGDEYFNAATTFAALRGIPYTLPSWVASGAFTNAMEGVGVFLIGVGWFIHQYRSRH